MLRNACRFKSCLQPINMRAFLINKLERSKCKWMAKMDGLKKWGAIHCDPGFSKSA